VYNLNMQKISAATILRWGLAFVFFYAGIAGLLDPQDWIGYMPPFVGNIIDPKIALTAFSFYEIVLATMLFAGRKLKIASLFAVATLLGITIFNIGLMDVVFRDVGLIFAALALYELVKNAKEKNNKSVS